MRDSAKKDWMHNWVNVEITKIIRRDRNNIRNIIDLQGDDI